MPAARDPKRDRQIRALERFRASAKGEPNNPYVDGKGSHQGRADAAHAAAMVKILEDKLRRGRQTHMS